MAIRYQDAEVANVLVGGGRALEVLEGRPWDPVIALAKKVRLLVLTILHRQSLAPDLQLFAAQFFPDALETLTRVRVSLAGRCRLGDSVVEHVADFPQFRID